MVFFSLFRSSISLNVDRGSEDYYPGDIIKGHVKLNSLRGIDARSVKIRLCCAEWMNSNGKEGNGNEVVLWEKEKTLGGKHKYPSGEWKFEFKIPKTALPTITPEPYDKNAKEAYFAIFTTLSGLCAFFASLLGGLIAQALSKVTVHIATMYFINYHFLFIFASCARFVSLMFLAGVREKEAQPTMFTLQFIGDFALKRLILYKDIMLNAFGIYGKTPATRNNSR